MTTFALAKNCSSLIKEKETKRYSFQVKSIKISVMEYKTNQVKTFMTSYKTTSRNPFLSKLKGQMISFNKEKNFLRRGSSKMLHQQRLVHEENR
jgi:hypothetical protein